jgi:hypothetical protein
MSSDELVSVARGAGRRCLKDGGEDQLAATNAAACVRPPHPVTGEQRRPRRMQWRSQMPDSARLADQPVRRKNLAWNVLKDRQGGNMQRGVG